MLFDKEDTVVAVELLLVAEDTTVVEFVHQVVVGIDVLFVTTVHQDVEVGELVKELLLPVRVALFVVVVVEL